MHEALFYEKLNDQKVKCILCPHNCIILPDRSGFCGARANNDGRLESLVYGKVSSMSVDPIEKKPLFHFNPGTLVFSMGTLGCTMRCGHCQNWEISHVVLAQREDGQKSYEIPKQRPVETISPERAIELALENDCEGIAWTYNEPTVWFEYTLDCAKLAREKGLYTVYVTNGYINAEPLDMIGPYLDAFRVDVKGFTNEFYNKVARIADFRPVLEATERAKNKWNMHVEIVTNIIPTMNDDETQLRSIARWIRDKLGNETPWHVTKFIPYLEFSEFPPTSEETLERAHDIGMEEGLKHVYVGNVYGHKLENTFCPNCGSIAIERQGYEIISYDINEENKCVTCSCPIGITWNKKIK